MKIAFVSQGLGSIDPPQVSGSISIWTYEVINQLRENKTVIAYEMDGGRFQSETKEHNGVKYFYAPTKWNQVINRFHQAALRKISALKLSKQSTKKPFFASPFHNLGYILWVSAHLRGQGCDVIHIHQFSQYVPIVRLFNPKSKIVLHMNCEWLTQLDNNLIRQRLAKADLILGCSDYIAGKIAHKFPEFTEKIKTVYNGVNHESFQRRIETDSGHEVDSDHKPHKPQLLFVGRISPEKGIHILIGALRELTRDHPGIQLNIVGGIGSAPKEFIVDLSEDELKENLMQFYGDSNGNGDYYYNYLQQMVDDQISRNISFTGKVPYQQIVEMYQQADILINPSFSESFGMSLAEAMSAEKPVVATRVGGMVNVVDDGKTGIIVDPGDENALAKAILHLIENPELRERMGKDGRKRILKLFSWEQVARSLEKQYQRIL
jgi:glycosyltransferase involved in cell wall biosynthesis